MDTFFHHNQNWPLSSFDATAVQRCQYLDRGLEASEAPNRCLLAALPQIAWLAHANGAIHYFNPRWYEYTGLTEEESLGWEFLKVLHPEDGARFVAIWNLASKKPQSDKIECRLQGLDGTYRWFIGTQTPVIAADDQLFGWVGTYALKGQLEQLRAVSWRESVEVYKAQENPLQVWGELAPQFAVSKQQPANRRRVRQTAVDSRDSTAKLAQQPLRNLVNELSHAIIWEADAVTEQFTYVSHNAERLLGYRVAQWLSQPDFWVNLIHPEDRQWTVALCRKEMLQNRDYELEYRCIAADNRVVWLRDRAHLVRDDQGRTYKRRGLMVDITLAKRAEEELETRRRQQAAVAQLSQQLLLGAEFQELIEEGASLVSQALAVEYCDVLELLPDGNNLRLRAGVGWQPDLVGQATSEASVDTHAGYTLHTCQPLVVEDLRRETGFRGSPWLHDHNVISSISVIINKQTLDNREANTLNRPYGVLGAHTSRRRVFSLNDVDFLQSVANVLGAAFSCQQTHDALDAARIQLAQTTTALSKAVAALERRTQELDEFAYISSHDLKAPLRAIANLSQWIEDDIADQLHEENLRQMELLRSRVRCLEALTDGLLQYSRVGRFATEPESVDVEALLTQIIDTLTPPAQFTFEVAPEMPTLVTERFPLQQVFAHLIGNAIKHHPSSEGTVKVSVHEQSDAYEFAIADDGAGIAPRFHERVFVIFQTLQARDTVESVGVGLAIAKRIVESKGGSIRLESQEGRGATFYFTWPKSLSNS